MKKLEAFCDQNIDILDQLFMVDAPGHNVKNPLVSIKQLEHFQVQIGLYGYNDVKISDEKSLF